MPNPPQLYRLFLLCGGQQGFSQEKILGRGPHRFLGIDFSVGGFVDFFWLSILVGLLGGRVDILVYLQFCVYCLSWCDE